MKAERLGDDGYGAARVESIGEPGSVEWVGGISRTTAVDAVS